MSDPRLILTADGSHLQFVGGQPLMDDGLENLALICLFTSPGWCGNRFIKSPIGSDFEAACNQPITRQALNDIRNAAERALAGPQFDRVTAIVTNPTGHRLNVSIALGRGAGLVLTRDNGNWSYQAASPAHLRVNADGTVVPTPHYPDAYLDETAFIGGSLIA